jgi:outer membrane protein assembly factor BamB
MDPLLGLSADDPAEVGGHRLLARVGSGAMGTVYLARTPTGRTVALKLLRADLATRDPLHERFAREIEATARLGTHPHFPGLFSAGTLGERPWFATEYVVGPSLAEAVTGHGPWPEESVRALARRLADALRTLHGEGYVHRDLKPSNILLAADGPYVVDVGLVHTAGSEHLTTTGELLGTPAYMAPEQSGGADPGPPGDVFSLGAVLCFAACGRPPFGEGEPGEVLYRIAHQEPDLTAVPPSLRPLLADCLAKDPADRPDAAALAGRTGPAGPRRTGRGGAFAELLPPAVLADIAARTARVGEPPPPRATADRPARALTSTRRGLLAGGAAAAVAGVAGTAWWLTSRDDDTAPAAKARPAPTTTRAPDGAPNPVWEYGGNFEKLGKRAVLTDGILAVPGDDGRLHGVDARRGTLRWSTGAEMGSYLTRCAGAVVLGTKDGSGRLAVVQPSDGRGWQTAPLGVSLALIQQPVCASHGSTVYVVGHAPGTTFRDEPGDTDRLLVAYDVDARRVLWRKKLTRARARTAAAGAARDLFVLLDNDAVTAYRAADGEQVWRRALSLEAVEVIDHDGATQRAVAVSDDTVVVSGRGTLCLDLRTGRTRWSFDPEETGDELAGRVLWGEAAIDGATLYLTLLGRELWAVERDRRKQRWRWQSTVLLESPPARPPLLAGDLVFPTPGELGTDAVAIDRRTHRTAWTLKSVERASGSSLQLLADDERLYVLRGQSLRAFPLS